jgi:transposase
MIGSTRQVGVWFHDRPTDMRRSFDGLYAMVCSAMQRSPLSGDLFVFVGKNRKCTKVLYWDGTGLCVFAKRLERGCFWAPWVKGSHGDPHLTVNELQLFLEGSTLVGKMKLSPEEFTLK